MEPSIPVSCTPRNVKYCLFGSGPVLYVLLGSRNDLPKGTILSTYPASQLRSGLLGSFACRSWLCNHPEVDKIWNILRFFRKSSFIYCRMAAHLLKVSS